MISELRIQLLGTFQIQHNGQPVTAFRTDKIRALLAYLVVESGRPHRREHLAGLFWSEMDDRKAMSNLRLSLHRLCQTLGDGCSVLQIDRHSVCMHTAQVWVDVLDFEQTLTAVSQHNHPRLTPCPDCIRKLETAVSLYQGDFLPGFFLPETVAFDDWVTVRREWLLQKTLQALTWLVDYHQENGRLAQAILYVRRQLELEPWRESAHRQMMEFLAQSGQPIAALRQYEFCRRLLRDELGAEPDNDTMRLYKQIRERNAGQVNQQQTTQTLFASTPAQRISVNLPATAVPFVGRQAELQLLDQFIANPAVQLITIVGAGGMGKTRLAVACAAAQAAQHPERFPHGITFVALTAVTHPDHILPTIAKILNFAPDASDSTRPDTQQLLDYLQPRQLLLLLDNFEQLLDEDQGQTSTAVIHHLCQHAPQLKLLITSRERLHIQAEHILPLGGLPCPAAHDQEIDGYAAVQLFLQSARRLQPNFALSSEDIAHLIAICRLLDGMPLGLELAAAWVDLLPLAKISAEIQNSLDFLAADVRDWPDRHRSLRAMFDASWARLSQPEQDFFRQLSLFRGGFTRAAVRAVVGGQIARTAVLRLLSALVSKSLLRYDRLADRYSVHELLRQYGAKKLADDAVDEAHAQEQFAAYYAHWLWQQAASLQGEGQKETIRHIERDWENIRVAWQWAAQHGRTGLLAEAAFSVGLFLLRNGRYAEGSALFSTTSNQLEAESTSDDHRLALARVYYWQAVFEPATTLRQQYLEHSLALLAEAIAPENIIRADKAAVLLELGIVAHGQGDFEVTDRCYKQSLTLYRLSGSPWGEANVLFELGVRAWRKGDFALAEEWFTHALHIRSHLGDLLGTATIWEGLFGIAMFSGHTVNALKFVRQSYVAYEQLADQAGMARMKIKQAQVSLYYDLEGLDLFEEGLSNLVELGAHRNVAYYTVLLAMYQADEDIDQAAASVKVGLRLCQELGYQRGVAIAQGVLSRVALLKGQYSDAFALAESYLHQIRTLTQSVEYSDALIWLGWASLALGDRQRAEQCVCEVMQIRNYWRVACLDLTAVLLAQYAAENYQWAWQVIGYGESRYARHRSVVSQKIIYRFLPKPMQDMPSGVIADLKAEGYQLDEATVYDQIRTTLN